MASNNEEDEVPHLSYSITGYINKGDVYQDRGAVHRNRREEKIHG